MHGVKMDERLFSPAPKPLKPITIQTLIHFSFRIENSEVEVILDIVSE